jgi:hypothetical protein
MSFDGRLTRLEQGFGGPPGERLVTRIVLVEDPHDRLDGAELEEFLQTIAPDGTAHVARLADNGRGAEGPHISFGGDGWEGASLEIRNGHIIGDWRGGA